VRAGSGGEGGAAGAAGDASPARGGAGAAICGAAVHHAGRGDQRETLRQADNAADKRGGGAIIAGAASFASAIASPPSGTWPRQHTTNSKGGEAGKERRPGCQAGRPKGESDKAAPTKAGPHGDETVARLSTAAAVAGNGARCVTLHRLAVGERTAAPAARLEPPSC
jgi:hypothetical protein